MFRYVAFVLALMAVPLAAFERPAFMKDSTVKLEKELVARYGEAMRPRIGRGLDQTARFWTAEDGDAAAFEAFVRSNFAGSQAALDVL